MFLTTAIKTFSIYVSPFKSESDLNMCNLTIQFYFFLQFSFSFVWQTSLSLGLGFAYSAQKASEACSSVDATRRESTTSRTTRKQSRLAPPPNRRRPLSTSQANSTCHLAIWQFLLLRFGRVACACSNAKLIQYYFYIFLAFYTHFIVCV